MRRDWLGELGEEERGGLGWEVAWDEREEFCGAGRC